MPLKYFQNTSLGDGKKIAVEKVAKGQEVMSLQIEGGVGRVKQNKVVNDFAIFPKEPWKGFKISWEGGHIYCTENQIFVLHDYKLIPAKELVAGKYELLGQGFSPVPITMVEAGTVMCGKKKIQLDGSPDSMSGHLFPVSGVWVGDQYLEDQVDTPAFTNYDEGYIYPGNAVMRAVRRVMMAMMGKREDLEEHEVEAGQ